MIRERHLLGPGPSNPYPEATRALAEPLLGHLDPEFLRIMDETCEMLRTAWGTSNARTLPLSATGSAGMEAAFVNTVHPGDVVVVAVNGLFGQRMTDVAARCGAEVVAVDHEWGQPVAVDRVLVGQGVVHGHDRLAEEGVQVVRDDAARRARPHVSVSRDDVDGELCHWDSYSDVSAGQSGYDVRRRTPSGSGPSCARGPRGHRC